MRHRTPDEDRFNPPVRHHRWRLTNALPQENIAALVCAALDISDAQFDALLNDGGLHCNDVRLTPDTVPAQIEAGSELQAYCYVRTPEPIPLTTEHILFQRDGILAVNKPAWLPVQGTRVSVSHALEHQLRLFTGIATLMAVHRLDRQTSGIVLFGETAKITGWMMQQFAQHRVQKKYLALVSPAPTANQWETQGYLERLYRRLPQNVFRLQATEVKKSKWSHTQFRCVTTSSDGALVECVPVTGRTHQLRVHLSAHGTPIVGDDLYGGAMHFENQLVQRIQLHAAQLTFPMSTGAGTAHITLEAPLPGDFL